MQLEMILKHFAQFIETELGIVYAEHNYFQLQNRLEEIAKLIGEKSLQDLYEKSQKGIAGAFRQLLLDVATNNETSFFRDPKIFKALEHTILPKFRESTNGLEKMNIWSAASSTGQEALSTAMTIKEWNLKNKANVQFSISATDISERVLARAQAAQYSQLEVQRGLPAPYMIKYFKKDEQDRWTASSELTQNISYKKLNLKNIFSFQQNFYLIMCRNVLIYQSVEGKKDILNRMAKILSPGGYLILGSGESLLGLSSDFEQVNLDGAVIYQRKLCLSKSA